MKARPRTFEFDGFRIDLDNHLLTQGERPVPLTPKAFDTLAVLVERHGEVLSKEELLELVWPGTFVEEATLTQNIYTLRKTFSEAGAERTYIETLPRRGYRFTGPVQRVEAFQTEAMPLPELPPYEAEPAVRDAALPPPIAGGLFHGRRRLAALSALLVALTAFAAWRLAGGARSGGVGRQARLQGTAAGVASIAVLPFEPLTDSPEDAYLGLGMADALITRLSNLHGLIVRPTSAVRRYTEEHRDAVAIGRELKVDAVLDGTLQRSGNMLRVSVQLVGVGTAAPLWAKSFDAEAADVFTLQDSLSQRLASELELQLTGQERARLTRRATENAAAYEAYVRGRFFWNRRNEEGLAKAIGSFRQAIQLDPGFALAHAGLADCYVLLPIFGSVAPGQAFPQAKEAAARALELDATLAEAHTSLAYAHASYDWDFEAASRGFERAIALNPGYPTAHQWYGFMLAALGRHREAEAELRRAVELDPLSLVINTDLGMVLYFARRHEAAAEQFRRTLELDPGFAYAHFGLGHADLELGRRDEAVAELRQAAELSEGSPLMQAAYGYALGTSGRAPEARQILADLSARARRGYVEASHFAFLHIGLGEKELALEWLAKACEERSRFVIFLSTWPIYDSLRDEPGWGALVERVGLGRR